jgi:hypothetical protein
MRRGVIHVGTYPGTVFVTFAKALKVSMYTVKHNPKDDSEKWINILELHRACCAGFVSGTSSRGTTVLLHDLSKIGSFYVCSRFCPFNYKIYMIHRSYFKLVPG